MPSLNERFLKFQEDDEEEDGAMHIGDEEDTWI